MKVRTAPWASPDALERLAAVEAQLPDDPRAILAAAYAAAEEHTTRVRDGDALLLYAGGNVPPAWSDTAGTDARRLISAQPSMGYPGAKYQAGIDPLDVIEVAVTRLLATVMGAEFAEVRPTSATLANLAIYTALAQPGETIAVLPDWAGGHLSHHEVGAAGVRGLRVAELPYDTNALDIDLDALPQFLDAEQPKLVVVGASLMLRPHRLTRIADAVHAAGVPLLYDASHVAGLIAEGRFQAPLRDGADLISFSTYKSFGGPPGGVIVGNDAELMERVTTAVYPGLVANYDIARLLPLGEAAVQHRELDGAYADACIANAQALAAALIDEDLNVIGGGTESHHVAIDVREFGGGTAAAIHLAGVDILLSEIGCPAPPPDPAGAIRIGTQSITRQGKAPGHMPAIAEKIATRLRADRPTS